MNDHEFVLGTGEEVVLQGCVNTIKSDYNYAHVWKCIRLEIWCKSKASSKHHEMSISEAWLGPTVHARKLRLYGRTLPTRCFQCEGLWYPAEGPVKEEAHSSGDNQTIRNNCLNLGGKLIRQIFAWTAWTKTNSCKHLSLQCNGQRFQSVH